MSEKQEIKKNVLISVFSLFFQSGYGAALGLAANLVLSIVFSPQIFGIYITVLSLIGFLNYFSDIGLAASLIQKKDIDDIDVATVFTVQQILIIALVILGYFSSRFVQRFYELPHEGLYLFWFFLAYFYLSSLKTIPSFFFERKIQFRKIVFVQVIENTVFYITVILTALAGLKLNSFTIAVLVRSITGTVIMYSISFWRPKFGINFKRLKSLLNYGVSFQSASLLALFKDDLLTLFLSKTLGFTAMGYIGWAKKWAEAPIRIIMDNLSRVLFPLLSALQKEKTKVSSIINKMLYYQTAILAPFMVGTTIVMPKLVLLIPKYNKWEIAIPIYLIFSLSAFFSSYSTPFINLFNSLGKSKISLYFMIFWTVAIWALTPLLSAQIGFYGFPIVQLLLATTFVVVVKKARSMADFQFMENTFPFIAAASIMGVISYCLTRLFPLNYAYLFLNVLLSAFAYFLVLVSLFKKNLLRELLQLVKHHE